MASELKQKWYVLHTKSKFENVVADGLLKKSLEAFLPRITVKSKRKDRKAMIRVPLFPGYVFVETDLNPREHLEIVKTIGAVRLISAMSVPVPVPNENIESLKIMVAADQSVITGTAFEKGDRIIVVNGPLMGITGIFSRYRGQDRVVVQIEALSQFAAVEVSTDDIELLPSILS